MISRQWKRKRVNYKEVEAASFKKLETEALYTEAEAIQNTASTSLPWIRGSDLID